MFVDNNEVCMCSVVQHLGGFHGVRRQPREERVDPPHSVVSSQW